MATLNQVKRILPLCEKTKITLFLWGESGVGKTSITSQYCDENDIQLHTIRAGQMEAGDFIGLPTISNNRTIYCRPDWLPEEDGKKHMFFLDEINRARIDVVQALFQFVEQKRIHQYSAPEKSVVVCAGNPSGDYDVIELDPAFWQRCLHINVQPTIEEWLIFMKNNTKDKTVIDTIRLYPQLLGMSASNMEYKLGHSNRSWSYVASFMEQKPEDDLVFEVVSGLVGHEAALSYMQVINAKDKPIPASKIIDSFQEVRHLVERYSEPENARSDLLKITIEDMMKTFEEYKDGPSKEKRENILKFLTSIPADLTAFFVQKAFQFGWFKKFCSEKAVQEVLLSRQNTLYNEVFKK